MLGSLWEVDCTLNSPSSSFKLTGRLCVDLYVCVELIRVTVNVLLQHFKGVVQELNRYSCIHNVSKATYRHFCSVEARLHYYITWQKASASPWIICFMLIQQKNTINVRDKDVKGGSSFIIWSWQDCTVSTSIFKTPPITSLLCSCVAHSSIIKSHHTHSALRTKREDHFLLSSFTPTSSLSWRITIN